VAILLDVGTQRCSAKVYAAFVLSVDVLVERMVAAGGLGTPWAASGAVFYRLRAGNSDVYNFS
jgi:hypothetical protein